MPVVRLRSAVCLLGRFPALAGVDLDVDAGEVVLLSGANGAGQDHAAAAAARAWCRCTRARPRCSASTSRVDRAGARRRPRARRPRDLLLRRPHRRARTSRFAARARRDAGATTPTRRSSGSASPPSRDVAHGRLSAGQRRRLALADRARARARAAAARRAARRPRRGGPCGRSTTSLRTCAGRGSHRAARVARARARAAARRPRGRAREPGGPPRAESAAHVRATGDAGAAA